VETLLFPDLTYEALQNPNTHEDLQNFLVLAKDWVNFEDIQTATASWSTDFRNKFFSSAPGFRLEDLEEKLVADDSELNTIEMALVIHALARSLHEHIPYESISQNPKSVERLMNIDQAYFRRVLDASFDWIQY